MNTDRDTAIGPAIAGVAMVLLPLIDAAVPGLGRSGQAIAVAVALFALRSELRPALLRSPVAIALLAVVTLAVVAIGMGERFGSSADSAYLIRVVILVPVWIAAGSAIGSRGEQRLGFFDGVVLGSFVAAVLQLAGQVPAAGHIEVGRAISIAIPLVTFAPAFVRIPAPRLARVAVFSLLVTAAVTTGARGPVVFGVGTVVLIGILKGNNRPDPLVGVTARRLAVAALSAATLWVAVGTNLLLVDTDSKQLRRQQELLTADSFEDITSARARIDDVWGPSIELIGEYPITGTGLPASLEPVGAGNRYPHNLVLEFGVAFGVGGVLLGLGVVAAIVGLAWRSRHDAVMLTGLAIHQLLNSMVSAELGTNRWVFFGLAALIAHDRVRRWRSDAATPEPVTARA